MSNSLTWMCTRVRARGFDIDVKSVDIRVNCPYESPLTHMSRMLTWMSHKTHTHMDVTCADNHVSQSQNRVYPSRNKLRLSLVTHTVASDHGSSTPDDASRRTLTRGVAPASHLRADARTAAGAADMRRGTNTGQAPADSAHRDGRPMTLRPSDASGQTLASPHAIARRRDRRRQTARRLRWQQCQ